MREVSYYAGWIWCPQELTTGRISGVIFQSLIVMPSRGMSREIASDSNSTSWRRPSTMFPSLYSSFTTCMGKKNQTVNVNLVLGRYIELTVRCASIFHVTTK